MTAKRNLSNNILSQGKFALFQDDQVSIIVIQCQFLLKSAKQNFLLSVDVLFFLKS